MKAPKLKKDESAESFRQRVREWERVTNKKYPTTFSGMTDEERVLKSGARLRGLTIPKNYYNEDYKDEIKEFEAANVQSIPEKDLDEEFISQLSRGEVDPETTPLPTPIPSGDPSFRGGTQIPPMSDVDVELLQAEIDKNNRIKQFADKQNASLGWSNEALYTLNYNNPEGFGYTKYSALLEKNNFNPYSSIFQNEDTTADIPDTQLETKIEAPAPEPEPGTDAHRKRWLEETSRSPAARAFEKDDPRRADWDMMRYEQMLDHKGIRPAPKSDVSTGKEIDATIAKDRANENKG